MIRLGWHRCKHCGLHRCKRRCDDLNRGAIEPGASAGWSAEQKRSIVAEAFAPGASVCVVARRADVVPSLIYRWCRELRSTAAGFAHVRGRISALVSPQAQKGSKPCAFTSSNPKHGGGFAPSPAIPLGASSRTSMDPGLRSVWSDPKPILLTSFHARRIERAIDGEGFQLWRLTAKVEAPA
jgi:hypothetical protein